MNTAESSATFAAEPAAGPLEVHHLQSAWSPDGLRIVTASSDETVQLWDTNTDAPLAALHGHTDAGFSPAWGPDGSAS